MSALTVVRRISVPLPVCLTFKSSQDDPGVNPLAGLLGTNMGRWVGTAGCPLERLASRPRIQSRQHHVRATGRLSHLVAPATMHAPPALTLPVTGGHRFLPPFAGWKGDHSCTWQDVGFLPQHVRHVGRKGLSGQMNQSLPSSNLLLFVLLQVENALSPLRCPGRHPHALPQGPGACLWERPFLPTNPCKAEDQTRPFLLGDPAPLRSFGGSAVESTSLPRPRAWEGRVPQGLRSLPSKIFL